MTLIDSLARRRRALALLVSLAMPLAGCSLASFDGGAFGATPGGAQDLGLARELIAEGTIPPPDAFVTEGIFSEHDLPVEGAPCSRTLCVRGTAAIAPDLDGSPAGWIQVGLSSTIDPATYERPAMTVIATVDVSGSMGWGASPDAPGELTRSFLHALVDRLDADDDFAMVTYGSEVETPVPLGPVDAHLAHTTIDYLHDSGVTRMEAGVRRAFELAREARRASPSRPVRVFLFTDVQPNVGATTPTEFQELAAAAAEDDIGLTVLGTGTELGQTVMLAMSHLRGGNAFTMFRPEDVDELLEDSWPWMAIPIAHELSLTVKTESGVTIARGIGFPGDPTEDADEIELGVASVFLSRRRGALLIETRGDDLSGSRVNVGLSYLEPDGTPVSEAFDVVFPELAEGETEAHAQEVTRRSVALALMVDGMREAARVYSRSRTQALAHARAAHARIEAAARATGDEALEAEVELAAAFVALIERNAPQRPY